MFLISARFNIFALPPPVDVLSIDFKQPPKKSREEKKRVTEDDDDTERETVERPSPPKPAASASASMHPAPLSREERKNLELAKLFDRVTASVASEKEPRKRKADEVWDLYLSDGSGMLMLCVCAGFCDTFEESADRKSKRGETRPKG